STNPATSGQATGRMPSGRRTVLVDRKHVDQATTFAAAELDPTVRDGKQGVIAASADVVARMEVGAPLANDDGASLHGGAVIDLDPEPLGVAVPPVAGRAAAFRL